MKKQDFTVLKIVDLHPFPDNPFRVVEDEMLMELAESIKEFGMVTPIITRPMEDGNGYEVIAGQRRVRACELAGIDTVPAFVLPLDRDRAIITLVDSNIQRENILPSERAFAYKMKLEAMKRQGFRTDLTSPQLGQKLTSVEQLAQKSPNSRTQIQRFIRLTELIPPILQMVDDGKIALTLTGTADETVKPKRAARYGYHLCDYDRGKGKPERNGENRHGEAEKILPQRHNAEADGGHHHQAFGA